MNSNCINLEFPWGANMRNMGVIYALSTAILCWAPYLSVRTMFLSLKNLHKLYLYNTNKTSFMFSRIPKVILTPSFIKKELPLICMLALLLTWLNGKSPPPIGHLYKANILQCKYSQSWTKNEQQQQETTGSYIPVLK